MTFILAALSLLVFLPLFILLPLYCLTIQYERQGKWRVLIPLGILALAIDVVLNFSGLSIVTLDFPKWGEWTFSKRLSRLQYNTDWRGEFARYIAGCLDKIAPSGKHIY
jgi:hypothetical protein